MLLSNLLLFGSKKLGNNLGETKSKLVVKYMFIEFVKSEKI